MTDSEQRGRAGRLAEDLALDAVKYPDQRAEILLEAAGQWSLAGEPDRALRIYEDVNASAEPSASRLTPWTCTPRSSRPN